jgi:histone H3/H4
MLKVAQSDVYILLFCKFFRITKGRVNSVRACVCFRQLLPSALVLRIVSEVLAEDILIEPSVRDYLQTCVSRFILHLTAEACTKCEREGRKAIGGDDILWSIDRLGFKEYEAPLRTFLRKHRAIESEDRLRKRKTGPAVPGSVAAELFLPATGAEFLNQELFSGHAAAAPNQRPLQAIVVDSSAPP